MTRRSAEGRAAAERKVEILKGRSLRELSTFCTWRLAQAAPFPLGTTTEAQARGYLTREGQRYERRVPKRASA